jgi:hypothetical protein
MASSNHDTQAVSSSQTLGVNYLPEAIPVGNFRYNWSAGTSVGNRTGGGDAGRQLTLQLSHQLSRSFSTGDNSTLSIDINQAISGTASTGVASGRQLTHGGSISWSRTEGTSNSLVRLSASDTRSIFRHRAT